LAAIAEFELDLIREGRARAMSKGVKFGRKPKLSALMKRRRRSHRKRTRTRLATHARRLRR